MHKLTLDPEMLRVESFAVSSAAGTPRGTVDAHGFSEPGDGCVSPESQNCPATIHQAATCGQYSCGGGCAPLTFTCTP